MKLWFDRFYLLAPGSQAQSHKQNRYQAQVQFPFQYVHTAGGEKSESLLSMWMNRPFLGPRKFSPNPLNPISWACFISFKTAVVYM